MLIQRHRYRKRNPIAYFRPYRWGRQFGDKLDFVYVLDKVNAHDHYNINAYNGLYHEDHYVHRLHADFSRNH
ncbi:hypothetical protein CF335_g3175, partial [Tilletia laevis]